MRRRLYAWLCRKLFAKRNERALRRYHSEWTARNKYHDAKKKELEIQQKKINKQLQENYNKMVNTLYPKTKYGIEGVGYDSVFDPHERGR